MKNIDIMTCMRRTAKFYDNLFKPVCAAHGISAVEGHIIAFLSNNPGVDTASDICEYRMLPKSNVSVAVESLITRGWLSRLPDDTDRRVTHLILTEAACEAAEDLRSAQQQYFDRLLNGLTQQEKDTLGTLLDHIAKNAT